MLEDLWVLLIFNFSDSYIYITRVLQNVDFKWACFLGLFTLTVLDQLTLETFQGKVQQANL